jgi:hypothetical protein
LEHIVFWKNEFQKCKVDRNGTQRGRRHELAEPTPNTDGLDKQILPGLVERLVVRAQVLNGVGLNRVFFILAHLRLLPPPLRPL